mgnify:CR=1 FL=1
MPKAILTPLDRGILAKVPWAWCSEATILMHCGALGNQTATENVKGALERLKASGHVIHRPHGVIMWRRNKEA